MIYYLIHDDRRGKPVQVIAIPQHATIEFEAMMNANVRLSFEILGPHCPAWQIVRGLQEVAKGQDDD